MNIGNLFGIVAATALVATSALADYDTHPNLRPENRCVDENGVPFYPGAGHPTIDPTNCQRLIWDLPIATRVGFRAAGSPFSEDLPPRFPRGLTDRIPPRYICDAGDASGGVANDGIADDCDGVGGPDGYEQNGANRVLLCSDPDEVPWWQPVTWDHDGDPETREQPLYGPDPTYCDDQACQDACQAAIDSGDLREIDAADACGPLFEVACRRGTRVSIGPWQTGNGSEGFDRLAYDVVRFENTERLSRDHARGDICDAAEGQTCTCVADENMPTGDPTDIPASGFACDGQVGIEVPATGRREWNTASEIYNHFGSHHGTCWSPLTGLVSAGGTPGGCNDPEDPWTASDTGPGGECESYQSVADDQCNATDGDPRCPDNEADGQQFRNATQIPGRLYVEIPDGRAVVGLEDQLWDCDHHVVTQIPPGNYGLSGSIDYRVQDRGIVNTFGEPIFETQPGDYFGGSIGEMVFQYLTEPYSDPSVKPVNVMFDVVVDAVTTWYPPYTYNVHTFTWYAPYDLAIGLVTLHSHHRMVKGTIEVLPTHLPRPNSPDPACGGIGSLVGGSDNPNPDASAGAEPVLYTNWEWEDAKVCEFWKEPDGPVILRKGQGLRTTCYVNNGVTPEAIKNGLVAGSTVEMIRAMEGSEEPTIPRFPGGVPADTWGDTLRESPLGEQLLYGTHHSDNYRVKYGCGPAPGVAEVGIAGGKPCFPSDEVDGDGDYVDGPYQNVEQCGTDTDGDGIKDEPGWCSPGVITFANVGEDEMCIPVMMYWALDRIGGPGHDEAMQALQEGRVNDVGLPGAVMKSPSDAGTCQDCPVPVGP